MTTRPHTLYIERSDNNREWFWSFCSPNGRELARSSETYKRRAGAENCARKTLGLDPNPKPPLSDGDVYARGFDSVRVVAPLTVDQESLLDLIANDPRKDDEYKAFVYACEQAGRCQSDRRFSINTVRWALSNDYGLVVEPRRYSSFWRRARLDGHIERTGEWETNTDTPGRNSGEPQPVYRWVGK